MMKRLRTVKKRVKNQLYSQDSLRFCATYNLINRVYWKSPTVVEWDPELDKIIVSDGAERVFIARPSRAERYREGISAKLDSLAKDEYLLGNIEFKDGDCVIDCGANTGEIGMWTQRLDVNVAVVSIEPEPAEADCCDLNVYGGESKTIRKALWCKNETLTFYSKNNSADSSVFETLEFDSVTEVEAITLTSLLNERGIQSVKLLKLEAEGAEPEILLGAESVLDRIDYISADLGPERGITQQTTAAEAINFLLARGFTIVDICAERISILFRNER